MSVDIIVIGDVNLDTLIVRWATSAKAGPALSGQESYPVATETMFRRIQKDGGALLLAQTIRAIVHKDAPPDGGSQPTVYSYNPEDSQPKPPDNVKPFLLRNPEWTDRESLATIDSYPQGRDGRASDKNRVYRIEKIHGWITSEHAPFPDDQVSEANTKVKVEKIEGRVREIVNQIVAGNEPLFGPRADRPRIIVIHDRDHGFRDVPLDSYRGLFEEPAGRDRSQDVIVLETSLPLPAKPEKNGLWDYIVANYAQQAIVIVQAAALRKCRVHLPDDISIEHQTQAFLEQLPNSDQLRQLKRCRHTIVQFFDGFAHFGHDDGKTIRHYSCPNQKHEYGLGHKPTNAMVGYSTILATALVKCLTWSFQDQKPEGPQSFPNLEPGLTLATALASMHYHNGFGKAATTEKDFYGLKISFTNLCALQPAEKGLGDDDLSGVACLQVPQDVFALRSGWSRIERFLDGKTPQDRRRQLHRIVKEDLKDILKVGAPKEPTPPWSPPVRYRGSFAQFGKLQIADPREIDQFMDVYNIIKNYINDKQRDVPLSIAVFGPPGTGKSFAVKQIAESVDAGLVKDPLEYNVAQFTSVEDLEIACHKAQDRGLAGETPLVFFDEFDAAWENQSLGWLKYFLAPMQDGRFKAGESSYRIGRALFFFAGGTSHTFKHFSIRPKNDLAFRLAKGPDFVSRLRGHLDIASIDSKSEVGDVSMFRRAVVLRALLKKRCPQIFLPISDTANIDDAVIQAFLRTRRYKHGVRSMEAIVEMANVNDKHGFLKSSIPSRAQLEMHVDAGEFLHWMHEPI